jgi:hypothetical protein
VSVCLCAGVPVCLRAYLQGSVLSSTTLQLSALKGEGW